MRSSTRLVGDDAFGVERRPDRHQREQLVGQHVELLVRERRQRDDGSPVLAQGVDLEQSLGDLLAGGGIRLRDDRDLLRATVAVERFGDAPVARARPSRSRARRSRSRRHRRAPARRGGSAARRAACAGLWMPRRVDDHELAVGAVQDAADRAPRRLRLVAGDRDLLADQRVRERRLADVRSADERDEAGRRNTGSAFDPAGVPGIIRLSWSRCLATPISPVRGGAAAGGLVSGGRSPRRARRTPSRGPGRDRERRRRS